jgi:hypothetical protein
MKDALRPVEDLLGPGLLSVAREAPNLASYDPAGVVNYKLLVRSTEFRDACFSHVSVFFCELEESRKSGAMKVVGRTNREQIPRVLSTEDY